MLTGMKSQLLISVVRRSRGDSVVEIARKAGAGGSTVLFGRGTAGNRWLRLLCLADVEKEIVFTIAPADVMEKIEAALRAARDLCVKMPGIGMVIDVEQFLRPAEGCKQDDSAEKANFGEGNSEMTNRVLMCIVVNAGLADDLMHAARDAGAKGGTILKARGTGRDEDNSFFGITIVPEKELLMIMTERNMQPAILEAIKNTNILSQPGVGVIFTMPVEKFFPLGKKANPDSGNPD